MKLLHQLIKFFCLLIIISVGLGQTLELENNENETWNVIYASPNNIAGFQFDVDGAEVISASGGAAEAAGFSITVSSTTVWGSSLTQATIPFDLGGILVVLELSGEPTGLSNMVFSDSDGNAMVFTFIWEGCPDDSACNYDENATIDNGNGSCLYPCSTPDGCPCSTPDGCGEIDSNFDCSGNCIVGLDCVGECGGSVMDDDSCTGCMDDGYQQWSPNPGSPACYYEDYFTIRDDCLYNDCAGICPNEEDYELIELDECGVCGGTCVDSETCVYCDGTNDDNCNTCADCAGVPNGLAYKNPFCEDDVCVGGDTGNADCLIIEIESDVLFESNSVDNTIQVFVTNLDTLKSLEIEFQYNSNVLQITDKVDEVGTPGFSLGTILESYYIIDYENFVVNEDSMKTIFMLYYMPTTEADSIMFFTNVKENIFNIVLETRDIASDTTTQIIINKISINENEILMDDSNWISGAILVVVPTGCTDESACNYDPNAREDDGSCTYESDCFGECGGTAENDVCGECDGDETNINNCNCPEDCNFDCLPIGGCLDEPLDEKGCAQFDECNICVGGATDRVPCEQDCTGKWGGSAYYDACGICIVTIDNWEAALATGLTDIDTTDCFRSSFNVYNSNGNIIENDIIPELDTIYVALHMQNLPDSLVGIDVKLGFDTDILSLDTCSINPDALNINIAGDLTGELLAASSYAFECGIEFDTTISALIYETSNELYQGDSANILFLQFSSLGTNGDSTVISYNHVVLNEDHVMKEQNYTQKMIYFGDCNGVFNGEILLDECEVCGGDGPAAGLNCDGEPLSLNESLIPQSYTLGQNYPNPFNPITYIQYSIPHYDFITIDIINISGQIINTIVQSSHQPGNYEIMWDGTNQTGMSVPSGIYFYKMDADEFISVRKLVLLK